MRNLEKLDFNFTISGYLAWTLTWYALMRFNILGSNIGHSSYIRCVWNIPDINKNSGKLDSLFWENPSIFFGKSAHTMKFNKFCSFLGKKVFCSNSLSQLPGNMNFYPFSIISHSEYSRPFWYLFIPFFLQSLVPQRKPIRNLA